MSIKAEITPTNPDDIEMTMKLTMPVHEWKLLKQQLASSTYPSWRVLDAVMQLISKAQQSVEETIEYDSSS